uniref:diacylglycerol cholinephosphotransferase n=1 Tax=Acrobeloides nanus TaxID=290746 RepID=A0A914CLX8_9BILA
MRPDQLVGLGEHKYSATDVSWLDELCMKKFWDNIVQYYPLWLAPNTITLIGLIINLSTVLILSFFCFSSTEVAPSWAYFQAALGLFFYQTLDATDGKQARRTNSSSPLGELFDHGCDSMSQVFVMLNVCHAMQLGDCRYVVLGCTVLAVVVFYCAHWSTYCTGQLRFSRFDVTEAQMVVISVLLVTALFGPQIWNISLFGTRFKYITLAGCYILCIWQVAGYMKVIFTEGAGKNGATVAGTSVIFPLFPLIFVCVPFCMIYSKSSSHIYDKNITLLALCLGAVAAKATNRLVIAHMSRSALELWDSIYLSPLTFGFDDDICLCQSITILLENLRTVLLVSEHKNLFDFTPCPIFFNNNRCETQIMMLNHC